MLGNRSQSVLNALYPLLHTLLVFHEICSTFANHLLHMSLELLALHFVILLKEMKLVLKLVIVGSNLFLELFAIVFDNL